MSAALTATPASVPGVVDFCLHCTWGLAPGGRAHAAGGVECDPNAVAFARQILDELRAELGLFGRPL